MRISDPGEVHEGFKVFTMGHLIPNNRKDDANSNWTYDSGSSGTALTGGDAHQFGSSPMSGSASTSGAGPSPPGSKNGIIAVPSSSNSVAPQPDHQHHKTTRAPIGIRTSSAIG